MTKEELKTVIEELFDARAYLDSQAHTEHHAWIQAHIEAEKARKDMYLDIAKVALQWSIPVLLGSVYYWLQQNHWLG